jgi:hypothetical protein
MPAQKVGGGHALLAGGLEFEDFNDSLSAVSKQPLP